MIIAAIKIFQKMVLKKEKFITESNHMRVLLSEKFTDRLFTQLIFVFVTYISKPIIVHFVRHIYSNFYQRLRDF